MLIRAQEIARYDESGVLDAELTGKDWVQENCAYVVEIADLVYSKNSSRPFRWVFAIPNKSPIQSIKGLQVKSIATEVKPSKLVKAIVEVTKTQSFLRANNLANY